MMLYKKILPFLLLAFIVNTVFSQNDERRERIEAQRISYITNEVDLTTEEAQQFWPIYNQYQTKKNALLKKRKNYMLEFRINEDAEPDKLEEIVDAFINIQFEEGELLMEYHQKYKTVLSIEKIMKLYQAEMQFKQFLLKQIRSQGQGNMPRSRR